MHAWCRCAWLTTHMHACVVQVRLAVAEQLVTPYTAAVGVMLQKDPLDPAVVQHSDVPLQVCVGG